MEPCLFNVQDFTAEGQYCLKTSVAPHLCAAACGVALDKVNFAKRRIFVRTVGKFAGECGAFKGGFAPCKVARVPCGFSCLLGENAFHNQIFGFFGVFFEIRAQPFGHSLCDDRTHFAVAEFRLGLTFELRVGEFHGNDRRQAFPDVVARKFFVAF